MNTVLSGSIVETLITSNELYDELRHWCCEDSSGCVLEYPASKRKLYRRVGYFHGDLIDRPKHLRWTGTEILKVVWANLKRYDLKYEINTAEKEKSEQDLNHGYDSLRLLVPLEE